MLKVFRLNCFIFALVFLLFPVYGFSESEIFPIFQGNRFPTMFMFLTPSPDSPALPLNGKIKTDVSMDYTSIFIYEEVDEWEVILDFEYTTIALSMEVSLADRFSISAKTSFVQMGKGFLDGFLDEYHNAGHFPEYGRSKRPHNKFEYFIKEVDGGYWIRAGECGFRPVDSVVSLKVPFEKAIKPELNGGYELSTAFKYSIKIPTGDIDQGLGSGGYDHGFYLLSRFKKNKITYYLNPGVIFLEKPETTGINLSINNMATLFAGAVYSYNDRFNFIAQLNCFSSPFDMGIRFFDDVGVEFTFGFNYKHSEMINLELAFSEDIAGPVPDFTVHSGVNCIF